MFPIHKVILHGMKIVLYSRSTFLLEMLLELNRAVHSGKHWGGRRQLPPPGKLNKAVYNMINHNNLKQKSSAVWYLSLKVLYIEATFCVGVKTKRPTRNPVMLCGIYPRRLTMVKIFFFKKCNIIYFLPNRFFIPPHSAWNTIVLG